MLHVKIGAVLFAVGVFLLLPFDEIFILLPLVAYYGIEVIPTYYAIALSLFVVGAMLVGVHVIPWLFKHPVGIAVLVISLAIAIYVWVPL